MNFFAVKVDGSDVNPGICLGTPGCFKIQTNHVYQNLYLFSSNSSYSVQNRVISFLLLRVFTITQIPGLKSLSLTLSAKTSTKINILATTYITIFSGVFKDYKCVNLF